MEQQRERKGVRSPLAQMAGLSGRVRLANAKVAEIEIEPPRHYRVGCTNVGQWVTEVVVHPRPEEIQLTIHNLRS